MRKIKKEKSSRAWEIPPEVWKIRKFDNTLLRHCNVVYNQNPIDGWMKGCILPFPEKVDLGLAKNQRSITLASIVAKIYNPLLHNRIEPKIENILRKNQNGFRRNRSTTSQILTIVEFLKVYVQKTYWQQHYLSTLQGFWLHSHKKDGAISTLLQPTKRNRRKHIYPIHYAV